VARAGPGLVGAGLGRVGCSTAAGGTRGVGLLRAISVPDLGAPWKSNQTGTRMGDKEVMRIPCPQLLAGNFGGKLGTKLTGLGHNQRVILFAWGEGCS